MDTLTFLGLFVITMISKKWIKPRFGSAGVQIFAFLIALIVIAVQEYAVRNPSFRELMLMAGEYLISAIALYELVIKNITGMLADSSKK